MSCYVSSLAFYLRFNMIAYKNAQCMLFFLLLPYSKSNCLNTFVSFSIASSTCSLV